MSKATPKNDNQGPLGVAIDLVFNLILPVYILEKFSHRLGENGAVWALIIALSFPLGFGLYDYVINNLNSSFFETGNQKSKPKVH